MSYQPAENLNNRTFIGLIIAQFLAGFNDQAIHAAAMFYAIHTMILSEANAITLMPILFYAPWAIFCTISGHMADRYSKTTALRTWKFSEIIISAFLIAGFWLGSEAGMPGIGGWIVMSCVFLMGTHAAFFAPAKYGAMPEILRPHILSHGNGILESTTFLASILGTVSGGLLFNIFRDHPVYIGVILFVLSVIGAGASMLIAQLPAASPDRVFPTNPFKPLVDNLKVMFRSRPLALAVLGIAFFVFMVSYMRASMYMHGETRNPRWDEQQTSLIVATVALGVGLGSPLAGKFSGGKVELGLVPLGCLGMIFALIVSALAIEHTIILVIALIIIGFFSGFYMVPLYTLLQHRAPKKSKGELVATSNFVNVTGAIAASILFNVLVQLGRLTNMTPEIPVTDRVAEGAIEAVEFNTAKHGKILEISIRLEDNDIVHFRAKTKKRRPNAEDEAGVYEDDDGTIYEKRVVDFDDNFFDVLSGTPQQGDKVIVSTYSLRNVKHYLIRKSDQPPRRVFDNEILPRYLFIGAALMTLGILILLCRKLSDFFVRSLFWFKSLGKYRLKAVGMQHLPTEGPVILVTNCTNLQSSLQLVSATDRSTKVILIDDGAVDHDGPLLRSLAQRYSIVAVRPDAAGNLAWAEAKAIATATLQGGHLLAVGAGGAKHVAALEAFLQEIRQWSPAPLLPVYCGALDAEPNPRVRVVFGEMLTESSDAGSPHGLADCIGKIRELEEWIRDNDNSAGMDHH